MLYWYTLWIYIGWCKMMSHVSQCYHTNHTNYAICMTSWCTWHDIGLYQLTIISSLDKSVSDSNIIYTGSFKRAQGLMSQSSTVSQILAFLNSYTFMQYAINFIQKCSNWIYNDWCAISICMWTYWFNMCFWGCLSKSVCTGLI